MSVIISADDFGLSEKVNAAITKCFEKGYVDRTTLMCNMPLAKDAMFAASKGEFIKNVGIHLNITSGVPLSDGIKENPMFCDANKEFNAAFYSSTKDRLSMTDNCVEDIKEEFRCQFEEYRNLGGNLWHVDSHHHVHTNLSCFKALSELFAEYPIESMRLSRNLYHGGNPLKRAYKNMYNRMLIKHGVSTEETLFGSFSDFKAFFKFDDMAEVGFAKENKYDKYKKARDYMNSHTIEIMVHPSLNENGEVVDITQGGSVKMSTIRELVDAFGPF